MGGLRTSIIGRPRPSPGQQRANQNYTLNCNEPDLCSVAIVRLRSTGIYKGV